MKTKKNSQAKKARSAVHKRSIRRRPVHKRVLLHPFTAFVLLCVGVLTAGATFHGQAISYDVTAKIAAAPIASPAVITDPVDGQHLTAATVAVKGTCEPQSYVKLYKDTIYSGSSVCTAGEFDIQVALAVGANELEPHIFNLTDDEGPAGAAVTLYRDVPVTIPPPVAVPAELRVVEVGDNTYALGSVRAVSDTPTISGYAPPFSDVTVTFHSDPVACKTKANGLGVWSCTLAVSLPPGIHDVIVTAVTRLGKKLTLPTFQVAVIKYAEPFYISSEYKYKAHLQGQAATWQVALNGGTPPYELVADWGDGSTSKIARPDRSEFDLQHTYDNQTFDDSDYAVVVRATDARGATTVLQFSATIKGLGTPAVVTRGIWTTLSSTMRQWLWVIWPAYIAVVLMGLSFWIGEREAYQRFLARRRISKPHVKGGHR